MDILGQKRYLCNSVRVTKAIVQKFGSTADMRETLTGEDTGKTLDAVVWLMLQLMDGGYRYAKINGLPCPEPPSEDDLLDGYDLSDLSSLQMMALKAMNETSAADVEAESKNAATTVGQ